MQILKHSLLYNDSIICVVEWSNISKQSTDFVVNDWWCTSNKFKGTKLSCITFFMVDVINFLSSRLTKQVAPKNLNTDRKISALTICARIILTKWIFILCGYCICCDKVFNTFKYAKQSLITHPTNLTLQRIFSYWFSNSK
jgi:hypothetical protein